MLSSLLTLRHSITPKKEVYRGPGYIVPVQRFKGIVIVNREPEYIVRVYVLPGYIVLWGSRIKRNCLRGNKVYSSCQRGTKEIQVV